MAFEEIVLPKFLEIGENDFKKPAICTACLDFIRPNSQSYYFFLTQKVKKIYSSNLKFYISFLSHFLDSMIKSCQQIGESLWSQFFYYGFSSLNHVSPSTRASGTRIIAQLFSEVAVASDDIINDKMDSFRKLITDPWWEVKAQAIIIYKAILLSKFRNQTGAQNSENINQDLTTKTLLHYILEIFKPQVSHNILRVGLVQLAELLNY